MKIIFWISWIINFLIMLICFYETYAVSSNRSLATPAYLLLLILITSTFLYFQNNKIAMYICIAPAGLALAAFVIWFIFLLGNNKWQ